MVSTSSLPTISQMAATGGITLHHGSNVLPFLTSWLTTNSTAVDARKPADIDHHELSRPSAVAVRRNTTMATTYAAPTIANDARRLRVPMGSEYRTARRSR